MEIVQPGGGVSGGGTVTSVSVVSANGLAGSVANPTTTPAITLSTSVTGILKGDGTAISAAALGTDYGNVVGPASATDTAIARYSGTTGKIIQDYSSNPPLITGSGQVFFGAPGIPTTGTVFNTYATDLNTNVILNSFQAVGTLNAAGNLQSLNFNVTDTGTNNVASITGVNGLAQKNNTGTATSLIAINASSRVTGGGVATAITGFNAQIRVGNTSVATTITNFLAAGGTMTGTAAATSVYGFRTAAMKITGVTTGYGFASDGTSDISYIMGTLGIGVNPPTARFHIAAGTATANTAPLKLTSGTSLTTPEAGAVEYDGNKLYKTPASLIREAIVGCIFTQTADKTVTNTVTETSIIGTGVGYGLTLPTNFFVAGKTIRLRIGGIYTTPALATPSLVIKVKYGATVIATVTTTALLSGATNLEFDGEVDITCRTTGATGTVMVHGDIEYATGVVGTIAVDPLNNAGATTTIDTTASSLLDVTITWDSATSTRSATSTVATVEVLN